MQAAECRSLLRQEGLGPTVRRHQVCTQPVLEYRSVCHLSAQTRPGSFLAGLQKVVFLKARLCRLLCVFWVFWGFLGFCAKAQLDGFCDFLWVVHQ